MTTELAAAAVQVTRPLDACRGRSPSRFTRKKTVTRLNPFLLGLSLGAIQLLSTSAWADSASVEECYIVGSACTSLPGVCRAQTCYACDNGKAIPHDCKRCVVDPLSSSGGAGGVTDQPAAVPECPDDSGCTVRRPSSEVSVGAGMLGIGLVALALARRRRR